MYLQVHKKIIIKIYIYMHGKGRSRYSFDLIYTINNKMYQKYTYKIKNIHFILFYFILLDQCIIVISR